MAKRKGIAIMIVLFFAFAVGIVMFSMFQTNTNLSNQTKKTIYAMQAYYLAHSCMQFGKLQISLLPKEIYDYYGNGGNSNKVLFNIMFDNRSIYTNNNNNFIIKPSPISFKFKQINKELSVSISDSKSHSSEKNNKNVDKKRLTTDYSK